MTIKITSQSIWSNTVTGKSNNSATEAAMKEHKRDKNGQAATTEKKTTRMNILKNRNIQKRAANLFYKTTKHNHTYTEL